MRGLHGTGIKSPLRRNPNYKIIYLAAFAVSSLHRMISNYLPTAVTVLLLLLQASVAMSSDFPADADVFCLRSSAVLSPPDYDDNVRPLMDSFLYETLVEQSGHVWERRSYSGDDENWLQGIGGRCRNQVQGCNPRQISSPAQENYLFTQFIPNQGAQEISLQVDFQYIRCGASSPCLPFDVLIFEGTGPQHVEALQRDSYTQIDTLNGPVGRTSITLRFTPAPGMDGCNIAFRGNGTCVTISRVLAFSKVCRERVLGLVNYPTTHAPASGSSNVVGIGQCSEHSSVDQSGATETDVVCGSEGVWADSPDCVCDPGYFHSVDSGGLASCQACRAGTFKAVYSNAPACEPCPLNSLSGPASTECSCEPGFFRAQGETFANACTGPPSAPLSLVSVNPTDTTVELSWQPPASNGFRPISDLTYLVQYQLTALVGLGFENSRVTGSTSATVANLRPLTQYTFRVVAQNSVSDQADRDVDGTTLRAAETIAMTTEGVPDPIIIFVQRRPGTFTWQPPQNVNGELIGFDVRIYRENQEAAATIMSLDRFEFCFSPEPDMVPSGLGRVWVEVRAKTVIGAGEWSEALTFEIIVTGSPPTVPVVIPSTRPVVIVSPESPSTDSVVIPSTLPVVVVSPPVVPVQPATPTLGWFTLKGRFLGNNSEVAISDIGDGDDAALLCYSSLKDCCRTVRRGEWYFPDDVEILPRARTRGGFFRNRNDRFIRLNRIEGEAAMAGVYRCEIPDENDDRQNMFITLVD